MKTKEETLKEILKMMKKEEQDKIDKEVFGKLRDDLIEIFKNENYQQKRKMKGEDLLNMGVFGSMSYRDDLKDSVHYARKLGDDAIK